jgi:hypothetical protein
LTVQNRDTLLLIFITVVIASFYWGSNYIWDDGELFTHLRNSNTVELWTESVIGGRMGSGYYRPVAMTLMKWCVEPFWAHILITFCHVFSVLALYRLLPSKYRLLCLIFALHPLASEVLGWASALPDALALAFGLWSLVLLKHGQLGRMSLCLLLGILSKETAIVPMIAALISPQFSEHRRRASLFLLGVIAVAFSLRLYSGAIGTQWNIMDNSEDFLAPVLWSLGGMIWPIPLSIVRDVHVFPMGMQALGAFALFVGLYGLRNSYYRLPILLIFGSIAMAWPTMVDGGMIAERYSYMATSGLVWLIALVLEKHPLHKKIVFAGTGALILGCIWVHFERAKDWITERQLFESAAQDYPSSSYSHHFVGMVAIKEGRFKDASTSFGAAIVLPNAHSEDPFLYLMSLVESQQYDAAFAFANSGSKENLTADYIAYWAKASLLSNHPVEGQGLLEMLCTGNGSCDGPKWVLDLYVTTRQ